MLMLPISYNYQLLLVYPRLYFLLLLFSDFYLLAPEEDTFVESARVLLLFPCFSSDW